MNIQNEITVTITENQLKEIIAEYLTEHGSYEFEPQNVTFNVGIEWPADSFGENPVIRYVDCTAVTKGVLK